MESPEPIDEQKHHPTAQDIENERICRDIATRMAEEYGRCLGWAMGTFGPEWQPSHRHFLVDKAEERRCRHSGERPREAATVFTVSNAEGDQRHFMVGEDGKVTEVAGYEEGFGAMLTEPHESEGFVHKGQFIRVGKYSLCWSSIETYHPRTAEQLAALRQTREQRKAEREEAKWQEDNPLLHWAGLEPDG